MNKEELKEVLSEVLHEKRNIDDDTHRSHHAYIESELQRREDRKQMWDKFRMTVVGTMATGFVAGLAWVGKIVIESFKHGNHP